MVEGGTGGTMCSRNVQLRWVPSHLDVHGNEHADLLAEHGSGLHPNNLRSLSKRRRVEEWDALGPVPMEEVELTSGDHCGGRIER